MVDTIRYFGSPIVYGPDCTALQDDAELVVEVVGGITERMTVGMMVGYADSPVYPVAYQLAEAA